MLPLESVPNFSEGRDARDGRRDRRRSGGARAPSRRARRRGSQPLGLHPRRLRGGDCRTRSSQGSRWQSSGSTCESTRAHIRESARRTSCPFVPLAPGDMERARAAAAVVGERIGASSACRCSSTRRRSAGRRSTAAAAPAGLQQRVDDGELAPDFGPTRLHQSAGGVILGARRPLIAFNVNLRGDARRSARAIAAVVREKGGGFPGVRALGLDLPRAGARAGVDERRGLGGGGAARDRRAHRARGSGARAPRSSGSELVGLMPAGAAAAAAGAMLRIDGFDASHVLELRLLGGSDASAARPTSGTASAARAEHRARGDEREERRDEDQPRRVRAAVGQRDQAEHASEQAVGDLLLRRRVEEHDATCSGPAPRRTLRRSRAEARSRARAARSRAGTSPTRSGSRAPCGGSGSRASATRRGSIPPRSRPSRSRSRLRRGGACRARASARRRSSVPAVIVTATPSPTHRRRRASRRGRSAAKPSRSSRGGGVRVVLARRGGGRAISAAETKNETAFTAKKTLTGMKVRSAAATAQPPIESACAVACTSAFARWTFERSTSDGIVAP